MDRPGTILYNEDLFNFKQEVEAATGFICYEVTPGDQACWYGTSDYISDFQEMMGEIFPTGTIAFCMDNGDKYMYSKFKNIWYKIN